MMHMSRIARVIIGWRLGVLWRCWFDLVFESLGDELGVYIAWGGFWMGNRCSRDSRGV